MNRQTYLIRGGRLHTITHGTLECTDLLIADGKIGAIGKNIAPEALGCVIVDARGKDVYPGMIDTHTHMGLDEWGNWDPYNELNEMGNPTTTQLRAIDGLYASDRAFSEAADAGVTSIIVHTGSIQMFSGTSCAVKTCPGTLEQKLIDPCIGMKGGFGGTPKAYYGGLRGTPVTRMGEAYALRKALTDACVYRDTGKVPSNPEWNAKAYVEALQPLVTRKIPWRVHVYKLYDIMTCLRIAEEFDIRIIFEHGGETPMIAQYLADHDICVTVGPSGFYGGKKPETFYRVIDNVSAYFDAGTVIGFQSDHPIIHTASLPRSVGMYVRRGLDAQKCMYAMTMGGARIIGQENRIGSLDVGKDADIFISDGSPFDPMTTISTVWINGCVVKDLQAGMCARNNRIGEQRLYADAE